MVRTRSQKKVEPNANFALEKIIEHLGSTSTLVQAGKDFLNHAENFIDEACSKALSEICNRKISVGLKKFEPICIPPSPVLTHCALKIKEKKMLMSSIIHEDEEQTSFMSSKGIRGGGGGGKYNPQSHSKVVNSAAKNRAKLMASAYGGSVGISQSMRDLTKIPEAASSSKERGHLYFTPRSESDSRSHKSRVNNSDILENLAKPVLKESRANSVKVREAQVAARIEKSRREKQEKAEESKRMREERAKKAQERRENLINTIASKAKGSAVKTPLVKATPGAKKRAAPNTGTETGTMSKRSCSRLEPDVKTQTEPTAATAASGTINKLNMLKERLKQYMPTGGGPTVKNEVSEKQLIKQTETPIQNEKNSPLPAVHAADVVETNASKEESATTSFQIAENVAVSNNIASSTPIGLHKGPKFTSNHPSNMLLSGSSAFISPIVPLKSNPINITMGISSKENPIFPASEASKMPPKTMFISPSVPSKDKVCPITVAKSKPVFPPSTTNVVKPQSPLQENVNLPLSPFLNSDDSDEETSQAGINVPKWAAKESIYQLKVSLQKQQHVPWKAIFRPSERIGVNLSSIFNGAKYRDKPRTSSAVWDTPQRSHHIDFNTSISRPRNLLSNSIMDVTEREEYI